MKPKTRSWQFMLLVAIGGSMLLFASACGDSNNPPADGDTDTDTVSDGDTDMVEEDVVDLDETDGDVDESMDQEDMVETDGDIEEMTDMEDEGVEPIACQTYGESFDLLPEGIETQIQPDIAWDGYGLWLVYTANYAYGEGDEDKSLQVFAARIDCNGSLLVQPIRVSEQDTVGYLNPKVAVSGGNIMIAYASDNADLAPRNLNIFTRRYTVDGTAVDEHEVKYEGTRKGSANDSNAWMPDVAPLPNGEFILVGAWGHSDAAGFQIFAQRFNADGSQKGEAIDMLVGDDQLYPRVDTLADGTAYIVFQSFSYTGPSFVAKLPYDATEVASGNVEHILTDNQGDTPSVTATPAGDKAFAVWSHYFINNSHLKPTVKDVTAMNPDGISQDFGTTNPYSLAPAVGMNSDTEGVVAYITTRRPPFGDVTYNRFEIDENGDYTIVGGSPLINTEKAVGIYGVNMARIADGEFMIVWSEGTNPDFKVRGQLVKLEAVGDLCDPNPCTTENQTVCGIDYQTETGYACTCDEGYMFNDEGTCVVDHCYGDPCADLSDTHRNVCVRDDSVDEGFICDCESGWRLDTDNDVCVDDLCDPNPCTDTNKTACVEDSNAENGYVCGCDEGYVMDGSENCVLPCTLDPCTDEHRTVCVDDASAANYYVCNCDEGWRLDEENDVCVDNLCDPNPCTTEHQTVCTEDSNAENGYTCGCDTGWIWDDGNSTCIENLCDPNPCTTEHQTVCTMDSNAENGYTCGCDEGWVWDDGNSTCIQETP